MRANGYLRLAVPDRISAASGRLDPPGRASRRELARHDGATALAVTMHLYLTVMQGFRYRDVRAGTFHPLTPEATLAYAGKLALGDPGVTE